MSLRSQFPFCLLLLTALGCSLNSAPESPPGPGPVGEVQAGGGLVVPASHQPGAASAAPHGSAAVPYGAAPHGAVPGQPSAPVPASTISDKLPTVVLPGAAP